MTFNELNKINDQADDLESKARAAGRFKQLFSTMKEDSDNSLTSMISRMTTNGSRQEVDFLRSIINEFADVILQVAISRKSAEEQEASLRAQAQRMTIAAVLGEPMP